MSGIIEFVGRVLFYAMVIVAVTIFLPVFLGIFLSKAGRYPNDDWVLCGLIAQFLYFLFLFGLVIPHITTTITGG